MKYIYILFLLSSCGYYERPVRGHPGTSGASCTVAKADSTTTITCPDGTQQTVVDGEKGLQGAQGATGPAGPRGAVGSPGHDGVSGRDGMAGEGGLPGPQGAPGTDGTQGLPGTTGSPGTNGTDGAQGLPGTPGTQITPVIPCPGNTSGFPEVLLCIDDSLYAVYDAEPNGVHYTKIPPGSYVTTDSRSCYFTVTAGCTLQ